MSHESRLLGRTALPLLAAVGLGVAVNPAALPSGKLVSAAAAQANPCAVGAARRAANPCAARNPCAAAKPASAVRNPCAAKNPCAASKNPCAASSAVSGSAAAPFDTKAKYTQAPFGNNFPDIVDNYLRATPYVGTGGLVKQDAFPQLKQLGFKTVINLLTAKEGAEKEGMAAKAAGLNYINLPVSELAPLSVQVVEFTRHVQDPANYPILLHCESSNRVGAMWALYRAGTGVPAEIAVQEGRTVGLKPSREKAVREILKLPPQ